MGVYVASRRELDVVAEEFVECDGGFFCVTLDYWQDEECPLDWEDGVQLIKLAEPWPGGGYSFGDDVADTDPDLVEWLEGGELGEALMKRYTRRGMTVHPVHLTGGDQGGWVTGLVVTPDDYAEAFAKVLQAWFEGDVYRATLFEITREEYEARDVDVELSDAVDSISGLYGDEWCTDRVMLAALEYFGLLPVLEA